MRILHTGDWHLGHTLREHARTAEHQAFLQWLVATIVERQVDVLLIAGDVFDSANPVPSAWRAWFDFLGACKRQRPALQIVAIAGNHDSAARLEAPADLLAAFDVRVVGALRRGADGRLAADNLLVPLRGRSGRTEALCVALPFLRSSDVVNLAAPRPVNAAGGDLVLPRPGESAGEPAGGPADGDPLVDGMRALHAEVFAAARARLQPGQALIAMAHGLMVGGALSELSERKVLGGNQHALPIDLFPADCAYVALGHLHRPQLVAGHEHIRYCGSPLPLAIPERDYGHQVAFVDFADGMRQKTWVLRTPTTVELLRIPARGECTPDDALAAIAALPLRDPAVADDLRPLLEVALRLPSPQPGIGERIAQALAGKAPRLVRVEVVGTGHGGGITGALGRELQSLRPEEVFEQRYKKDHAGEVPAPLLAAFRDLLEHVEHTDIGAGA
jgi:exonuclease SbcD